jgi:hypothetical protein
MARFTQASLLWPVLGPSVFEVTLATWNERAWPSRSIRVFSEDDVFRHYPELDG